LRKNKEITTILDNVILTYSNEKKELFQAIQPSKEGMITGRIGTDRIFYQRRFFSNNNIKTIKTVQKNEIFVKNKQEKIF